ncbi:tripartite tricarboxylate transporter TctB family protein [Polaromonas sp.]|uniref:tripartite tricarboxylate transporter TctB family protein n=1 Tax=Polaromonas sp. TaxID=1869339 RepID=UPI003569312B
MKIKSQPDFFSGLMFIGAGIAFAWGATNYTVGEAARMGPGYFPLILGILMALVGAVITLNALGSTASSEEEIGKWAWRPLFYVIGANVVFGLLLAGVRDWGIPAFGVIVGIYALTFVASMAQANWKFKPTLILATALAIGSYLVFVLALQLQFPVWPEFITG